MWWQGSDLNAKYTEDLYNSWGIKHMPEENIWTEWILTVEVDTG